MSDTYSREQIEGHIEKLKQDVMEKTVDLKRTKGELEKWNGFLEMLNRLDEIADSRGESN